VTVGEFFSAYGLFLAELLTIVAIAVAAAGLLLVIAKRGGMAPQGLGITKINEKYEETEATMRRALLGKEQAKKERRARKKEKKALSKKAESSRKRLFVLDFKGDIRATATASLREEVDAVLSVAAKDDAVLLRLENAGGAVHEHGFAASQLMRLKQRRIPLTISVDKIAASGGYLMACVADRIIAAPYAIIGSIGVIAQLPNFHRYLGARGIDFEQITAGRYKRTLTLFGENTEEGRHKLKEELEEVHRLFKDEIHRHRPRVALEQTATGEHWYGVRALDLNLVDDICTSDDYLLDAVKDADVFHVAYKRHKSLAERVLGATESLLYR
jgi:serine protease SohB